MSRTISYGFHPIPLGVLGKRREEEEKKKGKREKLWKIKHILVALLNPSYAVIHNYLHQCAQSCIVILSINSRSTCNCCSALLPIVHTSASTYLSTFLASHSTYFWTAQNIIISWAALTQAAPAFSNSLLFVLLCYLSSFTLYLCLPTKNQINGEKK